MDRRHVTDGRWEAFSRDLVLERHEHVRRELPREERAAVAEALRKRDRAIEEHLAARDQQPADVVPLEPGRRRTG